MSKKNDTTSYTSDMQITIAKLELMFENLSKQLEKVEHKVENGFSEIKSELETKYVTKEEHQLVRNIVFGMVGMILISFMGFLLTLAFK